MPLPVVRDLEDGEISAARQAQGDLRGGLAVLDGVFHEVDEHLLNQDDIHGDHQQRVGRRDARRVVAG